VWQKVLVHASFLVCEILIEQIIIKEPICRYSGTSVVERLSSRTNRFPNIKPKQKNAPVFEQNFGSRTGKLAAGYVRYTAASVSYVAASAQWSLLLEFAVPFLDFFVLLFF
jgi:hypothetical protein